MTRLREYLIHPFFIGFLLSMGISHYLVNDNPNKHILLVFCLCIAFPKIVLEFFLFGRFIKIKEDFKFFKTFGYFMAFGILIKPVLPTEDLIFEPLIRIIVFSISCSIGTYIGLKNKG